MLSEDAGFMKKRINANDMLAFFTTNNDDNFETKINKAKKIYNANNILNILSSI
jgi:hypothetical protein